MRILLCSLLLASFATTCHAEPPANLRDDKLIAWCIVPFDSKNRTPAERAKMLARIGLKRVAYDWRKQHVPTFEQEILEYKKHGIEYFAFWGSHEKAFALFEKHDLHPQIWQTLGSPAGKTQADRVKAAARQMLPLVERTRKLGCKLGLYNHGGWGGEPQNLVAVCKYLRDKHNAPHVGIVYNLHHGHGHLADFAKSLETMKPYLLCLNLNGMTKDGDKLGKKILPLGEGEFDTDLLRTIAKSGYTGPVGIIGHTQDDVELRLRDNLDGLHWLLPQLDGKTPGPKPNLRTYSPEKTKPSKSLKGTLLPNRDEYRQPPITVECRTTLPDARSYNILVASDSKRSGLHWEIFSQNGSGEFTAYFPGRKPDHVRTKVNICDNKPHTLAMIYEPDRVRLFVDGKLAGESPISSLDKAPDPGKLAIGRLVEGGLGCRGSIEWVHISRGARAIPSTPPLTPKKDEKTLLLWTSKTDPKPGGLGTREYSPKLVARLIEKAQSEGNAHRGLVTFSGSKSACLSCHRIGQHGGTVGPDLTTIGKQRKPAELVESVLWPKRKVEAKYVAHLVVDESGTPHQGYLVRKNERELVLLDPTKPKPTEVVFRRDKIEAHREVGSLMPENLAGSMSDEELVGLLRFLFDLGTDRGLDKKAMASLLHHTHAHAHAQGPATFPLDRRPLVPEHWPNWQHHVNRDRVYDFYAKQAKHFRTKEHVPPLLAEFPGLDGGQQGHWGNQNENVWKDGRWNKTKLGSVMSGIFRGAGKTVPRAVCVRLGEDGELSACFDPETLTYPAVWSGGFVTFSDSRHGFLGGMRMVGKPVAVPAQKKPAKPFRYLGFYRIGKRVVFSYTIDGKAYLDSPAVEDGRFVRRVAPVAEHPLRAELTNPKPQWPTELETPITLGKNKPYSVDTIGLPFENPWNALLFCGGHAFLPDGSALVCTMQGDVWRVSGFAHPSRKARWKRFASGLHHPLGMIIDKDGIFVLCRDQLTRLHDKNGDGEADFYERFSTAFVTSPAGHDFICGLQRDAQGRFYTASGNQGIVRISADGKKAEVLSTRFRNPDGLGLLPDGTVTVPCSEGEWTPASMICAFRPRPGETPHFGYRGPRGDNPPTLPLAYLPRGLDNSSGGQVHISGDKWGPLTGNFVHLSFGAGSHFLVLRDKITRRGPALPTHQGAVVPLPGEFLSGAHRGNFHPEDGQLYVTGMQGWGSYTPNDGCFQRVRYTGDPVQMPTAFHIHENGVAITFSQPLDKASASSVRSHFAQCWNYRYSSAYGSPEFSTRHDGMRGHDTLAIRSAHVLDDGRTLFLELPDLQPVNQLHLYVQPTPGVFRQLFVTVHALDKPFTNLPSYRPTAKRVQPLPILVDLARAMKTVPNPHAKKIAGARALTIETGTNLTYKTRTLRVRAGEPISLTLSNPDVVPHNWALVKPGTLERVGELTDRSISDPEFVFRHYIPATTDVLAYCDIVLPREKFTIYFRAPKQPGRYPYLCTFPGHWKVMNGVLIVE